MQDLLDTLDGWRAAAVGPQEPDLAVGRAVVVRVFGSAPRPEGAVLLVTGDGRIAGSISGGCVEGAVAGEIRAAREAGRERVVRYGISDEQAWDVGLACGGTIDVLVSPAIPPAAEAAARETRDGRGAGRVVVTLLPEDAPTATLDAHAPAAPPAAPGADARGQGSTPAASLVFHAAGGRLEGTLGDPARDERLAEACGEAMTRGVSRTVVIGGHQLFLEVYPARPRLVVVGAVEAARILVRLARELGYGTVVIDGRATFATAARFPDVDRLIVGWADEVADEIGLCPADAVAVLTHDQKFDEPAIVAALARGCRYVGAIGSRATQAERRVRLRAAGVAPADVDRLRGPIGLDLGGRVPAETALAIMAEVIAERRGGGGRPLRDLARERGEARERDAPSKRAGEQERAGR
jgi:xanthine dehydrogenase accessory factor